MTSFSLQKRKLRHIVTGNKSQQEPYSDRNGRQFFPRNHFATKNASNRIGVAVLSQSDHIGILFWYGMEAFLYTKGIQLTAAHSGGRCSDLTQEEVQHLWRYNLYSQG